MMKRILAVLLAVLMLVSSGLVVSAEDNPYNDTTIDWGKHTTHIYDNCGDLSCNVCGVLRDPDHIYDNACDPDCNDCGAVRPLPGHQYDNACDPDCNRCGAVRPVEHRYAGCLETICGLCGFVREAGSHVYTDSADPDCNECGATRGIATIVTQPKSVCVVLDADAVVTFTATGDGLTYQWYFAPAGSNTFYATSAFTGNTYSVAMNADRNGRRIYCVVTDQYGNKAQTDTVVIAMQPHVYDNICDATCNICGEVRTVEHTYTTPCDTVCAVCGQLTNPNATHSIEHIEAQAPISCQEPGNIECWICEPCGGVWLDEALTEPVAIEDVLVYKEHTYEYECYWYCLECGEPNPNAGKHNMVHVPEKAPTCQEPGHDAYDYCTYCQWISYEGDWWEPSFIHNITYRPLPMYHSLIYVAAVEATCTTPGNVEYRYCTTCGIYLFGIDFDEASYDYDAVIAYKDHEYAPATCTTPKTCLVCGATEGGTLEHSYVITVTDAPTCTIDGVRTFTCSCGDSYTESIPALGHVWLSATCTSPKTCAKCCETEGEALGHNQFVVNYNESEHWTACGICGDEIAGSRVNHGFAYNHNADQHWEECYCGYKKDFADHVYTNACDTTCDVCGSGRQVGDHVYDNACDPDCNICGELQEVGDHVWENGSCAICGATSPSKVAITKEPSTGYAQMGDKVSVKVTAKGEGLKYEWYIKNSGSKKYSKSSVTKSTYSTTMNDKAKDRLVFCRIYDQYGNMVQSKTVRLREAVSLTSQPSASAIYAQSGKKATIKINASGDGLTYTWYIKNDGASKYSKSSVTSSTYSATMGSKVKGRRVYCVVTDKYGKTVQTKTFILRESVSITTQPKTVTVAKNKTAKITVKASGDGLKYTWYIKNAGASKYSKSSVTTSSYSTTMTSKSKNRLVYCVVTDKYGNTVKTVTVKLKMK